MLTKFVKIGLCKRMFAIKANPRVFYKLSPAFKTALFYTQIRCFKYDEMTKRKQSREQIRDEKRKDKAARLRREKFINQEVYEKASIDLINKLKDAFIKLSIENDKGYIVVLDLEKPTIGIRIQIDTKPNPFLYDMI